MKQSRIDLEKYRAQTRTIKSRVFTGRDSGQSVREQSRLDSLFDENDSIVINIPNDIFSITPSFLEELLYNVVLKNGKEKVLSKLKFVGDYDIESSLEQAVERILQKKNGLEK